MHERVQRSTGKDVWKENIEASSGSGVLQKYSYVICECSSVACVIVNDAD